VRPYFGNGDEFQLGFHFPIMPRIFMAIKKGRSEDMREILQRTPPIPENCQWCIFLRNHDELTLEMVTEEERQWMWENYAAEPRMRLNLGIRRRLAPLLDNDARKIRLAHSLLFTLPGSPILYYGDEIGMGDNIWLDDRNGVRTPMQWEPGEIAGFSEATADALYAPAVNDEVYGPARVNVKLQRSQPDSLLNTIRQMIAVRKGQPVFGWGEFEWMDVEIPGIAAFRWTHEEASVLAIHNLSDREQALPLSIKKSVTSMTDLLTQRNFAPAGETLQLTLEPYQYVWLK
jgi:maltose alpha-D-glucosyltransferase / alpha-amylase